MKVTNEQLKRYVELSAKIAKLNKERGEIRKAILENGSCSTADYVATVETLKKERLSGKEEFIEKFGKDQLLEWGLIKNFYTNEVNVIEKNEVLINAG